MSSTFGKTKHLIFKHGFDRWVYTFIWHIFIRNTLYIVFNWVHVVPTIQSMNFIQHFCVDPVFKASFFLLFRAVKAIIAQCFFGIDMSCRIGHWWVKIFSKMIRSHFKSSKWVNFESFEEKRLAKRSVKFVAVWGR